MNIALFVYTIEYDYMMTLYDYTNTVVSGIIHMLVSNNIKTAQ